MKVLKLEKNSIFLYKALNRLEARWKKLQKSNRDSIDIMVKGLVSQEMGIIKDRDSHLQLKIERTKSSLYRLESRIGNIFRIQLVCIIVSITALVYTIISNK